MSLHLIGLNHKTAPLEMRERAALNDADCAALLPRLVDGNIVREAFVLSTCNRVEMLIEGDSEQAVHSVLQTFAAAKNLKIADFAEFLYQFSDADAARHLFRVSASLDSMIVGETQILGQVRNAYKIAAETDSARRVLHKLLHHALHTAKRVRTETRVAHGGVSVASAAVELSEQTFGSLKNKTILLVGAGEMAELAAKNLIEHGAGRILIANRTLDNAVSLALEFGGEAIEFHQLGANLAQADIVICSTAAPDFVITPEMIAQSQIERENRPVLLVDISVPRNIAPACGEIKNVFLRSIDDLQTVVSENLRERAAAAILAESIVNAETAEFWRSLQTMSFGETLGALRENMQQKARREFAKQRSKLGKLSPEQEIAVEKLLLSTVNQIAHPILYGLRQSHEYGAAEFAETLCDLLTQEKLTDNKNG